MLMCITITKLQCTTQMMIQMTSLRMVVHPSHIGSEHFLSFVASVLLMSSYELLITVDVGIAANCIV